MKIFVINLKSSVRRRKIMEKQLSMLDFPYEIFDAVKGSDVSEEEIKHYYDMDYYNNRPGYFTAGAVGCTLSHYFIYKKIVEEKIDVAIILEDDMILKKNFTNAIKKIADEIKDKEAILLFYQSYHKIKLANVSSIPLTEKFKLYQVVSIGSLRSTGGYIINNKTAQSMAEGLVPFSTFPDDWKSFYDRGFLNGVRVVFPFILDNSYEQTTISPLLKEGLLKKTISFTEKNKIFPFYNILKWRRKLNFIKTRECFITNGTVIDHRGN
ncbi:MAG: glycosyltransferase family 25 protein [Ferruginibacter sp.]